MPNRTFGTGLDIVRVKDNGTLRFEGAATVWEDINISLVVPTSGAAAPVVVPFNGDTGVGALKCIAFSGTNSTPDELPASLEVLHSYKEGTDVRLHVHFYPVNSSAGNVKFQARVTWFNRGTVPGAAQTYSVVVPCSTVAWQEHTAVIVIPGAGKEMGSRFVFNLFRDATDVEDTYAFNVGATDVGLHYEIDQVGSDGILIK